MDVDGLPIIGPGVNFNEVRAIHQKRTLAFINHFISNTVSFLNKFSRSCELRFEKFEVQIQKLEASLSILEAKLISISGLDNGAPAIQPEDTKAEEQREIPACDSNDVKVTEVSDITKLSEEPEPDKTITTQDPRIVSFLRMVHVGVPVQAVYLKMQAEGLDPNLLNHSGNAVPRPPPKDRSSDSESTASSFSD